MSQTRTIESKDKSAQDSWEMREWWNGLTEAQREEERRLVAQSRASDRRNDRTSAEVLAQARQKAGKV